MLFLKKCFRADSSILQTLPKAHVWVLQEMLVSCLTQFCFKLNDQVCHKVITFEPFPKKMFGTMLTSCLIRWVLESWYEPNQSRKKTSGTGARSPQSGCTRLLRLWWGLMPQLMPTLPTPTSKAKPP